MNDSLTQRIPVAVRPRFEEVVGLTDAVCRAHLSDEYADVAREAAAALARKRPSPIMQGQPKSWACGVVYALGRVNFLFDRNHPPYLSRPELCAHFGVSTNTGDAKARAVTQALGMRQMDPDWTLPSMLVHNPLVWMIEVDGRVLDARTLPPDIQEDLVAMQIIPFVCEEE
jgi:hypothetical protein